MARCATRYGPSDWSGRRAYASATRRSVHADRSSTAHTVLREPSSRHRSWRRKIRSLFPASRRRATAPEPTTMTSYCFFVAGEVTRDLKLSANHPHLESPQFKQVLQPSIMTTAAVL